MSSESIAVNLMSISMKYYNINLIIDQTCLHIPLAWRWWRWKTLCERQMRHKTSFAAVTWAKFYKIWTFFLKLSSLVKVSHRPNDLEESYADPRFVRVWRRPKICESLTQTQDVCESLTQTQDVWVWRRPKMCSESLRQTQDVWES